MALGCRPASQQGAHAVVLVSVVTDCYKISSMPFEKDYGGAFREGRGTSATNTL
jgi:hypothetical protein